jgi:hypothetical protein
MAKKSNHQRHVAQLRREKNLLRRQTGEVLRRLRQAETLLSFVLAQTGGTVNVSKGVGQTVMQNLHRLGYSAKPPAPGREDLDYVVITQSEVEVEPAEPQQEASLSIRKIEEEESPAVEEGQSPDQAVVD